LTRQKYNLILAGYYHDLIRYIDTSAVANFLHHPVFYVRFADSVVASGYDILWTISVWTGVGGYAGISG